MGNRIWMAVALAALLLLNLLWFGSAEATNPATPLGVSTTVSPTCPGGGIAIHPPAPTTAEPVSVTISGWWGSSCPAVTCIPETTGFIITLQITVSDIVADRPVACLDVVTPWTITQELGALLPGEYTVHADCDAGSCWSFYEKATFQVRALARTHRQYLPAVCHACPGP